MKASLKFPLIFFMVLLALTAFSQKRGYEPGYIINTDGDTIRGSIKDRSAAPFVELYDKIRFKANSKGRKQKLGPSEIQEYSVRGSVYRSVTYRENRKGLSVRYAVSSDAPAHFLKVIRESGTLIYYELEFIDSDNDCLDAVALLYKPGSGEMVRATQGIFGPKKKLLSAYFEECKDLIDEINKRKSNLKSALGIYEFYLDKCGKN